jgi:hypothetical protein
MYSLSQAPLAPPRAAFRSFLLQAPGSEALRRPRESAAGSAARAGAATKCVGASGAGPAPNAVRPYKRLCGLCCRARSLDRGLRRVGGYSGKPGHDHPNSMTAGLVKRAEDWPWSRRGGEVLFLERRFGLGHGQKGVRVPTEGRIHPDKNVGTYAAPAKRKKSYAKDCPEACVARFC